MQGWLDPSWTSWELGGVASALSAGLLCMGAARRLPSPVVRFGPLLLGLGVLGSLPQGPAATGIAATLVTLPALGMVLRCARLTRSQCGLAAAPRAGLIGAAR